MDATPTPAPQATCGCPVPHGRFAPPAARPPWPYAGHCAGRHPAVRTALELRGLVVRHPGAATPALRGVDLAVEAGSHVALLGANGAGKSTLLRAAAGLLPAEAGELRVLGHAAGTCRHQVAFLPQRSEIGWHFPVTVGQLVLAGRFVHVGWFRRASREDRARVAEVLELLGIADLAGRRIGDLSGGQQQRALLARALVHDADLLLLDEPLAAVDGGTRECFATVLARLRAEGRTVVVSTHDLDRHDGDFDRAVTLAAGRLARDERLLPAGLAGEAGTGR